LELEFVRLTYEKHAAQASEKLRNSLGWNYKSAALPTELCRRSGIRKLFYRVLQDLVLMPQRNGNNSVTFPARPGD
jgi:hypothetical protein